jgi:hypothetical protein
LRWGTRNGLAELFGGTAKAIHARQRDFVFRYRSPDHWVDVFRTFYGPVNKAYASLDEATQALLTRDIVALIADGNRAEDGTVVLPAEYLEVVIERA